MKKPSAEELKLLLRENEIKIKKTDQDKILNFVRVMWATFVKRPHHLKKAAKTQEQAEGKRKRKNIKKKRKTIDSIGQFNTTNSQTPKQEL